MSTNPFNITKAVDYSDELIDELWVDMPGDGFESVVKPTSSMPMVILGGKGSGKTHIMRYFSYSLQKIRYGEDFLNKLQEDGYLGIYLRCTGLNSHRFQGKNIDKEKWQTVFPYYMELWFSQLVLNAVIEINKLYPEKFEEQELRVCSSILNLFDHKEKVESQEIRTFTALKGYISQFQKKVDIAVNNIALTDNAFDDLVIDVTPGRLTFGIPRVLQDSIPLFEDIKFLYLVDEYENITEDQQKYINTLIREKELPTTFKVGARRYGIKTKKTFSAEEEIKEGSEYELYDIDEFFRSREASYKKFIREICVKRLRKEGYSLNLERNSKNYIDNYFQEFNLESFLESLTRKTNSARKGYFDKIKNKLTGLPEDKIADIISCLKCEDNLLERTNVFLFYRKWKQSNTPTDFLAIANQVQEECYKYRHGEKNKSDHKTILAKFKNDIIHQLCRESGKEVPYLGLDNFIKMSSGIPRNLLIILKHIYRWSSFKEEAPFENYENKITADVQTKGLKDASSWFLEDARMPGKVGNKVQASIRKLGSFLQEIRFSDLPPECSISSFKLDVTELPDEASNVLDYLQQYSYLIRVDERRDKNSNRFDVTYQINGLIAPVWELSIQRRGVLSLSKQEAISIFTKEGNDRYEDFLEKRMQRYNAPFGNVNLSLFE